MNMLVSNFSLSDQMILGDKPPRDNSPRRQPPTENTLGHNPSRPDSRVLTLTDPRRMLLTITLTLTDPRGGNYLKTDTNPYS